MASSLNYQTTVPVLVIKDLGFYNFYILTIFETNFRLNRCDVNNLD